MMLLTAALALAPALPMDVEAAATPHGAIAANVQNLRRNNLLAFLEGTFSKAQMTEIREGWKAAQQDGPSAEEDAQFRATMAMLTAPGAEEELMKLLEPKLTEMKPQMGMMIGMLQGMGGSLIQENGELTAEEKKQAGAVLGSITELLQKNDITDLDKAREAVAVVCSTARKLELRSLKDVQKLSFEQLCGKGDIVLAGTKRLLQVYGVDVNKWLDSVQAETVSETGDNATVRIAFEILGVRQTVDSEMVRIEGRWHTKESVATTGMLGMR